MGWAVSYERGTPVPAEAAVSVTAAESGSSSSLLLSSLELSDAKVYEP